MSFPNVNYVSPSAAIGFYKPKVDVGGQSGRLAD